jgi:hypothetical protein
MQLLYAPCGVAIPEPLSRFHARHPNRFGQFGQGVPKLDDFAQLSYLSATQLVVAIIFLSSANQICRLLPNLRESFDKTHEQKSHHCHSLHTMAKKEHEQKHVILQGCHFAKNTSWKTINRTEGMRRYRYSQKISWDIPANRFETVLIIAMILPDAH